MAHRKTRYINYAAITIYWAVNIVKASHEKNIYTIYCTVNIVKASHEN